ncbi:MAG: thiamine-phosphate kinase [Alphaproteobacteria bacterium]
MREFGRIDKFFKPLSGTGSHNLQDDIANIMPYVVSTDTICEGVHFIGDEAPETIAHKLLAVNLSDLASSGAKPYGYTLNVTTPKTIDDKWFESFAEGLKDTGKKYNLNLLGGDSVVGGDKIILSATMFGVAPKNITLRKNAKSDDLVCLLGKIGGGVMGLKVAMGELEAPELLKYYQTPQPNIIEAITLNPYINASIDISDGLIADLNHICVASGVGIDLYLEDIPFVDEIGNHMDSYENPYEMLLTGGDDYVVACTIPSDMIDGAVSSLNEIGKELYVIGKVNKTSKETRVFNKHNAEINIKETGYEHK